MDEEQRLARFAPPEKFSRELDTPQIESRKNDFLDWLWSGKPYSEAAELATGEDQAHATKYINYQRKIDLTFNQKVENVQQLLREKWLPQLEENMFAQATKDTAAGGRLAFDLSKVLAPSVWGGKDKAEPANPEPKKPSDFGLSEWFDDPQPLDAEWKELDEPKEEE